ncbi:MAG: hypothetical protein ACU0FT_14370 [Paracoccus sp. (in: a-proteobacteria)]|uniref:hypothetical protein n=1 Tax=Paracoccus sp. TaxID=267 RepID=UPI00405942B7
MSQGIRQWSRTCRLLAAATGIAAGTIFATAPGAAKAHSFIVALDATSAQPMPLTSAIRGMRLAASERDSHNGETSDGHLGGIDLFIRPLPPEAAEGITWLKGAPPEAATIVVDFGKPDSAAARLSNDNAVVIGPGALPADTTWSAMAPAAADGFTARYRAAYGTDPDRQAAQGYNAARRIDRALRDQGGVEDREGLQRALDRTAEGTDWK